MSIRLGIDDAAWDSPWRHHRVGEKVLLSVGLVLTALIAPTWPGTILVSVASLLAILFYAKIRPRLLWAACAVPLLFLAISAISVAIHINTKTPAWIRFWVLSVDRASFIQAAGLLGHGIAGTLALMVLATTTPMVDLVTWLRDLKIPAELIDIAALMYRLLFLALGIAIAVHEASVARLGDTPRPWQRRFHNVAREISAVFFRTGHRAVRMQRGLELRGYESDLATLPIARERSWRFIVTSVITLLGIWVSAMVVSR
ncbi:MAG: cobalt ECF transporter T component CbiQ [Propionibacteriaceae bacterium]